MKESLLSVTQPSRKKSFLRQWNCWTPGPLDLWAPGPLGPWPPGLRAAHIWIARPAHTDTHAPLLHVRGQGQKASERPEIWATFQSAQCLICTELDATHKTTQAFPIGHSGQHSVTSRQNGHATLNPHSNTQPAHCCHQKRPRRSRSATLADSR